MQAPTVTGILVGLIVIGGALGIIERLWPSIGGQRLLRPGWRLDLGYWFFTPLVTRAITRVGVVVAIVGLAILMGWPLERATFDRLEAGHGTIGAQPTWLQGLELIVLLDFLGYWMHRLFHGRRLWPYHEIHHSSEALDWLSSVRVHPVNDLLTRIPPAICVVSMGYSPVALAGALPLLTVHAVLLHANVDWDFGPLRSMLASPRFHRWHHTSAEEGRDKNFAGLLPLWDRLFGTYHMPDRAPTRFGVDRPMPASLWGQLLWPFRRVSRATRT